MLSLPSTVQDRNYKLQITCLPPSPSPTLPVSLPALGSQALLVSQALHIFSLKVSQCILALSTKNGKL